MSFYPATARLRRCEFLITAGSAGMEHTGEPSSASDAAKAALRESRQQMKIGRLKREKKAAG